MRNITYGTLRIIVLFLEVHQNVATSSVSQALLTACHSLLSSQPDVNQPRVFGHRRLRQSVRALLFSSGVSGVDGAFLYVLADELMANVDMFRPVTADWVAVHLQGPLLVLEEVKAVNCQSRPHESLYVSWKQCILHNFAELYILLL